jgi:hypothetical protein
VVPTACELGCTGLRVVRWKLPNSNYPMPFSMGPLLGHPGSARARIEPSRQYSSGSSIPSQGVTGPRFPKEPGHTGIRSSEGDIPRLAGISITSFLAQLIMMTMQSRPGVIAHNAAR